jgi:hypothetical protein
MKKRENLTILTSLERLFSSDAELSIQNCNMQMKMYAHLKRSRSSQKDCRQLQTLRAETDAGDQVVGRLEFESVTG